MSDRRESGPHGAGPAPSVFVATRPGDADCARRILADLTEFLREAGLGADRIATVELVAAESINNVVEHAYQDVPGPVYLRAALCPDLLELVIRDRGQPLPVALIHAVSPPADPQDLPEGGFGWHLIHSLVDDVDHDRLAQWNQLRLVFRIS